LKVAIAFICDVDGKLLITQRDLDSHYGGYWELPGGKVEDSETSFEALKREVYEELDFIVNKAVLFRTIDHTVEFYLYHVQAYEGHLSLKAGQLSARWITKKELNTFEFPETNGQFFEAWFDYLEFNNRQIHDKG
jgi:8-oxo-dGTP diphosphatase